MAGTGETHHVTLTDIGDLYGFWCSCGRSVVGWRLKWEAQEAAEAHKIGNKPYGTCIYCVVKGELTRFGWCVDCHPKLAATRSHCLSCGHYVRRVTLSRRGICQNCELRHDKHRDEQEGVA